MHECHKCMNIQRLSPTIAGPAVVKKSSRRAYSTPYRAVFLSYELHHSPNFNSVECVVFCFSKIFGRAPLALNHVISEARSADKRSTVLFFPSLLHTVSAKNFFNESFEINLLWSSKKYDTIWMWQNFWF